MVRLRHQSQNMVGNIGRSRVQSGRMSGLLGRWIALAFAWCGRRHEYYNTSLNPDSNPPKKQHLSPFVALRF
jgi:hypothetical protein